jgi:hypothetical protein
LAANTSARSATASTTTNTRIGTSLATVTILLIAAASLTPRRIMKWKAHTPTADTATASNVLPSPNPGIATPSVDLINTQ